jgi:serine/threonine-protein kinase
LPPLVKVLDFGISKIRHSTSVVTRDHAFLGTTYYMAPEQAEGLVQEIEHTTDIFTLGTICYEALTGVLPFSAPSIPSTLYQICHHQPRPASTLNRALPAGVDEVLSRAMAKERGERYQRVGDFVQDLRRCLVVPEEEARPTQGVPATWVDTDREPEPLVPGKTSSRTGLGVLAGGAAVLLLVAGGLYMIVNGSSSDGEQAAPIAEPGKADTLSARPVHINPDSTAAVVDASRERWSPDGLVRPSAPKKRPAFGKKKRGRPRPKRPVTKMPKTKKKPEFLFENP